LISIFPELERIHGRDLIPLFDSIWDKYSEFLKKEYSVRKIKTLGLIWGLHRWFEGNGYKLILPDRKRVCVFSTRWDMNAYPEDRPFRMVSGAYFIGDKQLLCEVLLRFVAFAESQDLKSLLNVAWAKLKKGMQDYERTGGEYGFNRDFNTALFHIYQNRRSSWDGKYLCA
jgi:hypothetical protein